jgi:Zn finger protein HypA/HybF involved in hydrogenase expression
MILRLLQAVNRVYPFVVLFGYMGAFLLAFICIFSFPLGALVLVIGSVLSLAFVVFFGETLSGIEGILTRRTLKKNRCPACRMGPIQKNAATYQCLGCGICFDMDGAQLLQDAQEIEASDADAKFIVVD